MTEPIQKNGKDRLKEKYAEELSPKRYALKQLKQWGILFGGTAIGAFAGGKLFKLFKRKGGGANAHNDLIDEIVAEMAIPDGARKAGQKLLNGPLNLDSLGTMIGAMLGMIVSSIALAYEHWRKVESEKLAVEEMNRDISHMNIHVRPDPKLVKENDRLQHIVQILNGDGILIAEIKRLIDLFILAINVSHASDLLGKAKVIVKGTVDLTLMIKLFLLIEEGHGVGHAITQRVIAAHR